MFGIREGYSCHVKGAPLHCRLIQMIVNTVYLVPTSVSHSFKFWDRLVFRHNEIEIPDKLIHFSSNLIRHLLFILHVWFSHVSHPTYQNYQTHCYTFFPLIFLSYTVFSYCICFPWQRGCLLFTANSEPRLPDEYPSQSHVKFVI